MFFSNYAAYFILFEIKLILSRIGAWKMPIQIKRISPIKIGTRGIQTRDLLLRLEEVKLILQKAKLTSLSL